MKKKRFFFYLYRDPKTDDPIYAGKACGIGRAYCHLKKSTNPKLDNTLQKRIREGFNPQPEITEVSSQNAAKVLEIFWIAVFGREDLGTGTLYNLTNGGDGMSGYIPTLQQRENQRNKMNKHFEKPGSHEVAKLNAEKRWSKEGEIEKQCIRMKAYAAEPEAKEIRKAVNEFNRKRFEEPGVREKHSIDSGATSCTIDNGITVYPSGHALKKALGQSKVNGYRSPNFHWIIDGELVPFGVKINRKKKK